MRVARRPESPNWAQPVRRCSSSWVLKWKTGALVTGDPLAQVKLQSQSIWLLERGESCVRRVWGGYEVAWMRREAACVSVGTMAITADRARTLVRARMVFAVISIPPGEWLFWGSVFWNPVVVELLVGPGREVLEPRMRRIVARGHGSRQPRLIRPRLDAGP